MNPADEVITWAGMWLFLLAIAVGIGVHLLIRFTRNSWREAGRRIDEGMANVLKDDPIRTWREDPAPYDQDLDGTHLATWEGELG